MMVVPALGAVVDSHVEAAINFHCTSCGWVAAQSTREQQLDSYYS